jgi:ABC-type branched-subunit amino acid transport system permease subunit
MSSRRSDTGTVVPPAQSGAQGAAAQRERAAFFASAWWQTLRSNLPVPVLIGLVALLTPVVESKAFGPYNTRIVMLVGFNIVLAVSLQLINGFSGQFSLGHAGFMMVGAYLAAYPAMTHSKRLADPGTTLWFYLSLGVVTVAAAGVVLGLFLLIRLSRKLHKALPTALLIAVAVWVVVDLSQGSRHVDPPAGYVWSHGITLVRDTFSWLMEHGSPRAEKLSEMLPVAARSPATFVILLVGGGLFAAGAGLVVGIPALRLRGDYLAIATLGMAEIIRIIIQNAQPLGGALGLTPIPKYTNFAWLYGFAIVTIVVVWRIAYSARGRAIMAVREDEVAAAAVGIDTTRQKVLAFVTGAFFGGSAGALYALHERSITPSTFGIAKSIEIVVMVTLGGLGSISGAVLAAIILTLLPEVLRPIADYRMIIYSLLLVFMMLIRPQGLLGGRELWPRRRGPAGRGRRDPVATEDRDDRKAAVPS